MIGGRLASCGSFGVAWQVPRQEFGDTPDVMVDDALQHAARIGFRIEPVELGGGDQRGDRCGTLAAASDPANSQFFRPRASGRTRAQHAAKSAEMRPWMLGPAVRAVTVEARRAGLCRHAAARRGDRPRDGQCWSCRGQGRGPAPACRRRAARRLPGHAWPRHPTAAGAAPPTGQPSRRASSAADRGLPEGKSRSDGAAAGDRRIWPPGHARAAPPWRGRGGSASSMPEPG